MKLRMIAEHSIQETWWNRRPKPNSDKIAMDQSLKNLQLTSFMKLRNMLYAMGLSKGREKHSVIEPIGIAVAPFQLLRLVVQKKITQDLKNVQKDGLNTYTANKIADFWGFKLPTGFHDHHIGQMGTATSDGIFDKYLRTTVEQAQKLPKEARVDLLKNLAQTITNSN